MYKILTECKKVVLIFQRQAKVLKSLAQNKLHPPYVGMGGEGYRYPPPEG